MKKSKLFNYCLRIVLLLLLSTPVFSQQRRINGTVHDAVGNKPLNGATITLKNSKVSTVTKADGNFSIDVPDKNAVLVVSFISYQTQEIPLNGLSEITIALQPATTGLNEVVVIGYGTQKKATLTGAVSTIGEKQLEGRPAARTTELLQGMAPGVQIVRGNEGRIRGTQSSITIRGITSRSDPGVLVVIDGIPQSGDASYLLDNISPDDIASISILKDAQAAIYGARAAGGVILVTTKKGQSLKPTIDFSSTYTIQQPALEKKSVNILQLVEMMNDAYVNAGEVTNGFTHIVNYIKQNNLTMAEISKNDGKYQTQWPFDNTENFVFGNYYWPGIMYHAAPLNINTLSISGKTNKLNYYNSIGYEDQQSMLRYGSNNNKRFFARLKNSYDITNWLKINENIELERQKVVEPYNFGSIEFWQGLIWPVYMPYTPAGHYYNFGSHQNPIGYAEAGGDVTEINYRINSQLGFELTPVKNLNITGDMANNFDIQEGDWANLGFDMYNENDVFSYNSTNNRNSAGAYYNRTKSFVGNLFADYKFSIKNDHKFDLLAGYSHEEEEYRNIGVQRNLGLISSQLPTFGLGSSTQQFNGESKTDQALESFFSRLDYNYKEKYILEGNFRYDGSSKFAPGHKWSPFYGLSGAWTISDEKFMQKFSNVINFMKIRASWGQLGNEASIGLYDYIPQINIGGSYPFGSSSSPLLTQQAMLAGLGSATRTWERVDSRNLGIDFSVLDSRLSGSVDYFIKDNANMFYSKEFPQLLGVNPPSINGAHVRTKGWEVAVNWKSEFGNFGYNIGVNLSNSTNKVIQLADSRIPNIGFNSFVEGYSADAYFGYRYDGLLQSQGEADKYTASIHSGIPQGLQPGDAKYKDLNGDGKLTPQLYQLGADGKPTSTSGDLAYLGDAGQHYLFGINLGLNYKNFYFSTFFQGVLKWMVYDGNRAFEADSWPQLSYFYHNTWTPTQTNASYPELNVRGDINNNNYTVSDAPYRLFNDKYIRLKNIQFGYNVPNRLTEKYKIKDLRVFFSGTDVFELYNLPGVFDPEKPFNHFVTPFPRQFSFGLNLKF
ncbi:TonB-dependent receptor [Ginsengibacter hankyongi]|uniref:TonB-dependent receptor n=1 Tax=Ginsengibacter hankyongi TaxID=2607284 RepID=A0A5J5I9J6_9BACT|nr:TonB-dependent receptor [Ginsengibacter hankyongi]KAA9034357.1 TonB-dependent receptor [Ginsengibacter hankyongi]